MTHSLSLPLFQVDAFTKVPFGGNPAAVVPLPSWPEPTLMQAIAAENNLSETAFLVRRDPDWEIRWFTPVCEVDLCGHATLASAHVVLEVLEPSRAEVTFHSASGPLRVWRDEDRLRMRLPRRPAAAVSEARAERLAEALGARPTQVLAARDYLAVFEEEDVVRRLKPDLAKLAALDLFGTIATAPGERVDFVSRFFAPGEGIPEDPVTGSAHCTLIPYWSERLGRSSLHALQISTRGGELFCADGGTHVELAGHAVRVLEGTLFVPWR